MRKDLIWMVTFAGLVVLISILVLRPHVVPKSDATSYLAVMKAMDAGDAASAGPLAYRIIATTGGLSVVIALSKLFGSYESAWMFMNVFFYSGVVLFGYELVRRIQGSKKVAFLSAMFLAANYSMVSFGLGYFMDAGGWMFYELSALMVLLYAESNKEKYLWWAAAAVGIGALFKEYPSLGALIIGLYLLWENKRSLRVFFRKIWRPALISAVPTLVLQMAVYAKYHFTYFDWLASNQQHYVYSSRIIEFIKAYGSLLNLLGLLAVFGIYYFWKSWRGMGQGAVLLEDDHAKRTRAFVVCLFISMIPVLFWPAITQRILFVSVPAIVVLTSYLFKRFESRLWIFLPILALYFLISLFMDSYILNAVNLPF